MNKKSIAVSLLIIFLCGCEKDKLVAITDNPVNADLFVVYDGMKNTTSGTAIFWNANRSKRLIFHGAAKLLFEGYPMEYRSTDYSYTKELIQFYSEPTFTITDVNDETFINSISFNSIELPQQYLDTIPDTINTSQALSIQWLKKDGAMGILSTGMPLDTGETVTLRIETDSSPVETATARQVTIGSSSVTFAVEDFNTLNKKGWATLALERTKVLNRLPDPLGGGTGTITAQYISLKRLVYLK